jgi:hypothetical protein
MPSGPVDFVAPLVDQYGGKNHQSPGQNVGNEGPDHHDGLSETHLIRDETAAPTLNWNRPRLILDDPLDPTELVGLRNRLRLFDEPSEPIDTSHICLMLKS